MDKLSWIGVSVILTILQGILFFYLTILFVSVFVDKYNSPYAGITVACIVMLL